MAVLSGIAWYAVRLVGLTEASLQRVAAKIVGDPLVLCVRARSRINALIAVLKRNARRLAWMRRYVRKHERARILKRECAKCGTKLTRKALTYRCDNCIHKRSRGVKELERGRAPKRPRAVTTDAERIAQQARHSATAKLCTTYRQKNHKRGSAQALLSEALKG